IRAVPTFLR
ncbi:imidazole glycerol phosphate synthase subunit HisH domain protein, partial [Vibrio parahaemolyticus V-223/04]